MSCECSKRFIGVHQVDSNETLKTLLKRASGIVRMKERAKTLDSYKLGAIAMDKYALMAVKFVEELARMNDEASRN